MSVNIFRNKLALSPIIAALLFLNLSGCAAQAWDGWGGRDPIRYEVRRFHTFLQDHPRVSADLRANPRLVASRVAGVIAGVKSLPLTLIASRNRRRLTFTGGRLLLARVKSLPLTLIPSRNRRRLTFAVAGCRRLRLDFLGQAYFSRV
jgi:hypothetical protein